MVKLAERTSTKKIQFTTTRFGEVEIDEANVIRFVEEIPGFPETERFVLIPHKEDSPFAWLQSVDAPDVAFVVTDPWLFFEDYRPTVNEVDLEKLEVAGKEEDSSNEAWTMLAILTIPNDPKKMTANLKAPVIINTRNNMAKQVILSNEEYTTKHFLLKKS